MFLRLLAQIHWLPRPIVWCGHRETVEPGLDPEDGEMPIVLALRPSGSIKLDRNASGWRFTLDVSF